MFRHLIATATAAIFITACGGTPQIQTGPDAEVIGDNLHRVDNTRAQMAYIDPAADFSKYSRVLVRPLGVDNIEVIQPSSTGTITSRRDWELTDKDKQSLQEMFHSAMVKQLQERGDFPLASEPADDVLEIAAMITTIAPSAAKDDNRSRPTGRSYVITEGAGSIAVAVVFGDSQTREVLALVKDARTSTSHWGLNNSVSNRADVQRMFSSWAMQINTSLGRVTGKED